MNKLVIVGMAIGIVCGVIVSFVFSAVYWAGERKGYERAGKEKCPEIRKGLVWVSC